MKNFRLLYISFIVLFLHSLKCMETFSVEELLEENIEEVTEFITQTTQLVDEFFFADVRSRYNALNQLDSALATRFIATLSALLDDMNTQRYSSPAVRKAIYAWLLSLGAKKVKRELIRPPID